MPNVPRSSGRVVKLTEDQAGRRPVREQLAVRVRQLPLGGRDPRALVDDDPLAADHAGVGGDRADEVRLHLERRVADASLELRVHRAAHRRVEQRQRDPAVHRADRVVVLRAGLHLEDGSPRLGQDEAKAHQLRDRRRRQLARDDRLDVLHPRETAALLCDLAGIHRADAHEGDSSGSGLRRALCENRHMSDVLDRVAAGRVGDQSRGAGARATTSSRPPPPSGELPPEDLELLAWSAYLTDEVVQVVPILERAYAGYVAADNNERAAAVAVQLAHEYGSVRLQKAVGSGWLSRAERLLEGQPEGIAHGYLALERGLGRTEGPRLRGARETSAGRPSGSAASTATWGSSCAAGSGAPSR